MGLGKPTSSKGSSEEVVLNTEVISSNMSYPTGKLSNDQVQAVQQIEKAIKAVQGPEKSFEISVHKGTHAIMVKVFNKETGDLIREIPQEKLLDVAASMMEMNGLIIDKKA
ncbi:flagellar biosynthesis protein FlaG [Paenibacillus sp. HJL G12]|uniref:Flagellar biosynthesis protein FlaG n=2 Tax=Paenibacillus dendrobii TaxID=2691084 RepID=A0A7X3LI53_9BACL|nr:flagellar biosynthesis protein FlaG [Paenibacillus dendrobii]